MIRKIKSIQSFGIFHDFSWDKHVKSKDDKTVQDFNQINIIYGRNYSVKTTLSRIIRALETRNISLNYLNPQFSVLWKDGGESSVANLQDYGKTIRVFNEDFVRENLSFLIDSTNSQGQIRPFAIIGADNVKIEKEIKKIEAELGIAKEGEETGFYAKLKENKVKQNEAGTAFRTVSTALQKKKDDKATGKLNGIKYRPDVFGDQLYDIRRLDSDIQTVCLSSYVLIDDKKRQELEQSLNDKPKSDISSMTAIPLDFQSLSNKVKALVENKIGTSEKIQELLHDYAFNVWVKDGRKFHKNRNTCAFCGNEISSTRWDTLEKHFDEETEHLEQEIDQLIIQINQYKQKIENGLNFASKESFYTMFHKEIEELVIECKTATTHNFAQLDILLKQLNTRKQEITVNLDFVAPENYESEIEEIFKKYESICKRSNKHTNELLKIKKETQKTLRLHEVHTFVDTVDYISEKERINSLEIAVQNAEAETQKIQSAIDEKLRAIEAMKMELNDEEKGARKVSDYLNHSFGHQFLTLKPITDETADGKIIHFEIFRGDKRAFDLSEGECNLIAFCYFMAKLDDVGTSGKQSIIWIDDPISSLDGNHIFFVYGLLRAEIVDKNRFEQLFISTHSLEFLKYLKRLTGKNVQNQDYQKAWFVVERTDDNAIIQVMPKYLKEYITEFNYLFHSIYKCAKAKDTNDDNYFIFYNFGNNLRKFLDIYLYYKFPDGISEMKSYMDKISNLFGDKVAVYLTDRLVNEQSHLSGTFERGEKPIDVPEIQSVAQRILEVIKREDQEQYKSFLKSIGETETIEEIDFVKAKLSETKHEKRKSSKKEESHSQQENNSLYQLSLFEDNDTNPLETTNT